MTVYGPHTVTVVRPGAKAGDYGTGQVPDWANATEVTYTGCSVQPVAGADYTVDRSSTTTRWQVWADITTDVTSGDRLRWAGDLYEVDGEPQRWEFPPLAHVVIPLTRSEDT